MVFVNAHASVPPKARSVIADPDKSSNLSLMFQDPLKQFLISHPARSNGKADMDQLVIGALYADSVHFQEGQHDIQADPLIAVHHGVIHDKPVSQSCRFCLLRSD